MRKGFRTAQRVAVALGAIAAAGVLTFAIVELPPAPNTALAQQVAGAMASSGVEHPVTAVLLNFRGYDTLLEVAVLQLALLGIVAPDARRGTIDHCGRKGIDPVLNTLAQQGVPLMVLAAGYLLWAGAFRPGGAFQAAAVLTAAAVLLRLVGLLPAMGKPRVWMRTGLAAGFSLFLTIAAVLLGEGSLLRYPIAHAGTLILLIETCLTISLGLLLAGLYLTLSAPSVPAVTDHRGEAQQ